MAGAEPSGSPGGNSDTRASNGAVKETHRSRAVAMSSWCTTGLSQGKKWWAKTGITWSIARLMFKGALTPTIILAAYQSDAWSAQYSTLGYLIGVMAQLSLVTQPRAKFVQTMLVQVLMVCLATALAVLASYCSIQARISSEGYTGPGTGGPGTSGEASRGAETSTYNSSASAVVGVWLFMEIYGVSAFRAHFPQYNIPSIQFAIVTNVALTYAPQFSTIAQAESLCLRLLSAVLTGFAVATGVSLLVFPLTSRHLLFNEMNNLITHLRAAVGANQAYLSSLENTDMFAAQRTNTAGEKPPRSPEAEALQSKMKAVSAVQAKCATNLTFAVREVAFGKLGPDDLKQLHKLLQAISIPMVGLSSLSTIFERISEERGWDRSNRFPHASRSDSLAHPEQGRLESINEWHELIRVLKEPFEGLTDVIDEGLLHCAITLQLSKGSSTPPKDRDDESRGDTPKPGDSHFGEYLSRRADQFLQSKQITLRVWCNLHDIQLPQDYFTERTQPIIELPAWMKDTASAERIRLRTQLTILLYVEFLLWKLARRTHNLVKYADNLKASGKLRRTRLVLPGYKRLRKWLLSAMHGQDAGDHDLSESAQVSLGQAYKRKKDPEHLPPKNQWERCSDVFRRSAHLFGSPESLFAFRVATATLSIAVINLLHVSQVFFTKERLFWAQIMASIAMVPSAGQSLRVFMLRICGTAAAMVVAIVAYYIVDGKTAGILVLYFIFNLPGMFVMLRFPAIVAVGLISSITLTLILGYGLQVRKVGIQRAESNGQEYHPVYELAPIRLLTVMSGIFVAWIFSVFPYPITEHSQLRKNTANSLYLLANYYSTVNETTKIRLKRGGNFDETIKGSAAHKLAKARLKVLSKSNALLASMRTQTAFVKYDIPVGGSFPKERYQSITERAQSILNFMSLISIASATFQDLQDEEDHARRYEWVRHLRTLAESADLSSHSVTTLLSLLSASLNNAQPLPPYLKTPDPHALADKMDQLDPELMSVRHIAEPGYASFAVIQIASTCMIDDLRDLLEDVKELVGELDFSFHDLETPHASRSMIGEIHRLEPAEAKDDGGAKQE